jgi:hypothetical protein
MTCEHNYNIIVSFYAKTREIAVTAYQEFGGELSIRFTDSVDF